ncbi:MAG: ABC transporter ATP-binding protein [Anaerolineaceae bacterium]|nr:ABC transporter ATP-binding protein [Anaerolineaceae bacterium]
MTPYIQCKQVVKAYRVSNHEIVALRGIDFEMERTEMVAIIGPSGAGKSSLLNLLGGLDTPTAGQLMVDGQNLLELKGKQLADYRLKRVGFVWQQVERNLLPYRSARRNVTLPMMMAGIPPWERGKRANELLEAVDLGQHQRKRPGALSGGMQQRVAVAVALANRPALLLADEVTGALDRHTAAQVMDLLHDLRDRYGLTILMVTHDLEIAKYADRVLTLRDGALGQEMNHDSAEDAPRIDNGGSIKLPAGVRAHLAQAPRIAVEIRPEGVLLRPETDEDDDAAAALQEMLPQDAPPDQRRRWRFLRRRKKQS